MEKRKNLLSKLMMGVLFLFLPSLISCSNDDYPTVGVLRVEFTDWKQEWTNHLSIAITPIDQEDKVIKKVDVGMDHVKDIELNPGNYHIYVVAAVDTHPLYWHKYAQVQAGATETIKISSFD
ncbi:MAG: hypothetical protein WAR39_03905 [Prevotella sp.]